MQTKKEEIKKSIIKAAICEFKLNGYERASIRKIVKKAHTTIGNFYNYFESKEKLFENIVKDTYLNLVYFIKHHNDFERPDEVWDISDVEIWRRKLLDLYNKIIPSFDDSFLLLIDCSKGTKYGHVREDIIKLLEEHFYEHIDKFSCDYRHKELGRIYAIQLVTGFSEILKLNLNKRKTNELIVEQILCYSIGIIGTLQKLGE